MTSSPIRTIHSDHVHFGWDRSEPPVATIAPGDTVTLACRDAGDGQLGPGSTDADVSAMDAARVNPVTGPLLIDGAKPGDALAIRIVDLSPSGFGWTALIPGFGLLAEQFPDPRLHLWRYDASGGSPLAFGDIAEIPLCPFVGTIGTAPAEPGRHSVIPPRNVGGNMDIRDLGPGTTVFLPVEVAGALLSAGDTHAAQGDGEVCGTAIESAMDLTLQVDLVKDARLVFPRYETTRARPGSGGVVATTGIGPELMPASRDAVSGMIDHLTRTRSVSAEAAYMLCSVAGDLRISQIVDAPNWTVSFAIPKTIFADRASI